MGVSFTLLPDSVDAKLDLLHVQVCVDIPALGKWGGGRAALINAAPANFLQQLLVQTGVTSGATAAMLEQEECRPYTYHGRARRKDLVS